VTVGKHQFNLRNRGDVVPFVNDHSNQMIISALCKSEISRWLLLKIISRRLLVLLSNLGPQIVIFLDVKLNELLILNVKIILLCIG
jgi:hypothetical protein